MSKVKNTKKTKTVNKEQNIDESVAEILKSEEENGHPVNVSMDCLAGETL